MAQGMHTAAQGSAPAAPLPRHVHCTRPRAHRPTACSAELARLTERHGADYVVTEADVKAATAAAMQAALRGGM